MKKFNNYLLSLGGLHDAKVASIAWQPITKTLEFVLEDFYSNFLGMPEYPGLRTGRILLQGVSELSMDISSDDKLKIFEFLPSTEDDGYITVLLSPSGKIVAKFADVTYPKNELL
jgi:hypothetical protein